ncbi:hypothetical protein FI667_g9498, partial [Globisporangium splendens]
MDVIRVLAEYGAVVDAAVLDWAVLNCVQEAIDGLTEMLAISNIAGRAAAQASLAAEDEPEEAPIEAEGLIEGTKAFE